MKILSTRKIKARNPNTGKLEGVNFFAENATKDYLNQIDKKGKDVLESLPDDYIEITKDVSQLSDEIGDIVEEGVNLFNKDDNRILNDTFVNYGGYNSLSGYVVTHPIKAKSGVTYKYLHDRVLGVNYYIAICDDDGNFIRSIEGTIDVDNFIRFIVNEDCYVRVNIGNKGTDNFMLCVEDEYPAEYVPYSQKLNENFVLNEKQKEEVLSIAKPLFETIGKLSLKTVVGKNLFDKTAIINGYYINNTEGTLAKNVNSAVSALMPIEAGKQYHVFREGEGFSQYYAMVRFVAEDKESPLLPVGQTNYNATPEITATAPAGAAYMQITVIFNGYSANLDTLQVELGDTRTAYEEYRIKTYIDYESLPPDIKQADEVENPLKGKIVTFNGDSICYGAGNSGGYGKIIAEKNKMVYENIGVSGGTIKAETYDGNGGAKHWICRTIADMRADADYIILEGGVNDGVGNLGTLSDGYSAELDDTTFYGAFESMLKQALERFGGKKIGYIFAHKCTESFSSNGTESNPYYAAMKCLKKWGISYLDLNTECPPLNFVPSLKATYTNNGDGWHPNEEGYKKYYVPKIEAWMKTL